ncbi:chromosome segregation protein SMC [Lysinibacillus sp. 2017]|uniref:chromosome segregation protein SMC n=1 Tax=unclassified Lysinibacillus TaxID=2636778 RepID=UPI000D529A69|nr:MULTISPECIES: chromosome segregation protein SMC [unclassified Lysinibacillus]AWE06646.1 chromosome segregation protein SMC [Lysinibacillus sp. 2017]TGN37421.1 chromosome segregation protein SMC [Lysinibacillus sp. S2017]
MFLKRLEVVGFKSFAERVGIDFVPGVTAVVGPNGSGKSNVTDAIRWVLGEQSAKSLRGAKMEDVIFAGSESRKPLNFAEVTLVLDNEDERVAIPYTEVSVTRRVYRSGDSEYLLNNQQCRLKDITDLFMDSGLGKEAFSIISQGRVDEILNSRPDDRRSIFEEAAGVLKYKLRKKKAEHKLVETDENLNRVLDILHEIEVRLEPLKIQASSAKDYVRMTEELKDFDIALMVHDLLAHEKTLQKFEAEHKELSTSEKKHAAEITNLEQSVRKIRTDLKAIDGVLDASQEQLVEASAEVERWEGRRALFNEKRSNAEKQTQQLKLNLQQATQSVNELELEQQEKRQQFTEKQKVVQEIRSSLKQIEQALTRSASEIEQEIEDAKNTYINLLNEEATVKNELKHIDQQLSQEQASVERMTGRSSEMQKELTTVLTSKEVTEQALQQAELALQDQLGRFDVVQMQLKSSTADLDEKQDLLYKAYQHHQQLKARKETLAELEADFSGFFHGVKEILLARDRKELEGIEGAVAELIQVDAKYSQAIETALGAASQHIVTDNEQHAQRAIGWLKQKRAGRATFLPKTVMRSRKIQHQQLMDISSHPAYVALAYELVQYAPENQTIIENLLGNVLVAQNLEGASQIARLCGFKYRVVTLEGDIVNAGGSLTGGALKQQSSLFSRKAELDKLVTTLADMEATIQKAEKTVAVKKEEIVQLRHSLEELKLQGESLREQEQVHRSKALELDMTAKSLKTTVSITQSEQSSLSTRKESLAEQQQVAHKRLEELRTELQDIQQTVDELTLAKTQSETQKDVLREQLAQKRSELAVAQEQLTQVQAAIAGIELNLTKAQNLVEKISQEIEWVESEDGLNGPSSEELAQTILDWSTKKDALNETIQKNRASRTVLHEQMTEAEIQLQEVQRVHKSYMDALRTLEIKRSRIDFEMNSMQQQLLEQYELDVLTAQEEAIGIEDEEQVRRKVKLLKQSIEELGPVNLNAIEEFDRVQERYAFLSEQREDLVEAKDTLHKAIGEMDEEMTERFNDTFKQIRQQFSVSFRELFGGGAADLVLLDPENLLETGIEIIAQPPGKKLQNLSLLSGGERALTAIALLFAILNTRPVPFCILDEVEAALDESNVARYSDYLRKFSEDTQFIVITHRKGTMEGADVLYGITMQESGVSKLVSVKLEEQSELVGQGSGK